jgi:hypothetical protein
MIRAHHRAHIRRSIEDVFGFLADCSNIPALFPWETSWVERATEILEASCQVVRA